jgi:hypothetical protein
MKTSTPTYKNHRFPPDIISHAVWLYFRFCLSYRDVEELLFARGVIVTYEAIRNRTSRAFPPPHKCDAPGSRAPPCPLLMSTGNKLTTPDRVAAGRLVVADKTLLLQREILDTIRHVLGIQHLADHFQIQHIGSLAPRVCNITLSHFQPLP